MDYNFDFNKGDRSHRRKKRVIRLIIFFVEIAVVILLAFFFVKISFERTAMPGISMQPTLMANDSFIVNKLSYLLGDPKRFDIIVFSRSGEEHSFYNIKRIVGLPGERVQIKDGYVFINGEQLIEPVIVKPIIVAGFAEDEITLDEDEYFVLGDNRNESEDSRFANLSNVVEEEIIGKVWIRTSPFGFAHKFNLVPEEEDIVSGSDVVSGSNIVSDSNIISGSNTVSGKE